MEIKRPHDVSKLVIEQLKESYYTLYDKYGVQPNRFLLSIEKLRVLIADGLVECNYQEEGKHIDRLWGIEIIQVTKPFTAKAAIVLEE